MSENAQPSKPDLHKLLNELVDAEVEAEAMSNLGMWSQCRASDAKAKAARAKIVAMLPEVATARADGRREGLEMAAAWHDARAASYRAAVKNASQVDLRKRAKSAVYRHEQSATAIRAMMEKEG